MSASISRNPKTGNHSSLRDGLDRFCAAWQRHSTTADRNVCTQMFEEMNSLYESDHRHYHGPHHIHQCLAKLDEARQRAGNSPDSELTEQHFSLIELAIWFHDVIYTAGDTDNESRSANWFQDWAKGILEPVAISRINSLIGATEHKAMPTGDLEKLMVDIDLSSFSLTRQAFLEDGLNIRQEFNYLSDKDFVEGQSLFLRKLLGRPSIYSTRWFRRHCEATARQNIKVLLDMYEQGFEPTLAQSG